MTKRIDLLSENLVEIALQVNARKAYDNSTNTLATLVSGPSADVRERIIAAARALTEYECRKHNTWEKYDWYATCDAIGKAIEEGKDIADTNIEEYLGG